MILVPYFQGFSSLKWTKTSFYDDSPVDLRVPYFQAKTKPGVVLADAPYEKAHAAA